MLLHVHIHPNAKQNQIIAWDGQTLKLKIASPPLDGKANQELLRFLANKLDLPPSTLEIKSGHTSKYKRIEIPLTQEQFLQKLNLKEQKRLL